MTGQKGRPVMSNVIVFNRRLSPAPWVFFFCLCFIHTASSKVMLTWISISDLVPQHTFYRMKEWWAQLCLSSLPNPKLGAFIRSGHQQKPLWFHHNYSLELFHFLGLVLKNGNPLCADPHAVSAFWTQFLDLWFFCRFFLGKKATLCAEPLQVWRIVNQSLEPLLSCVRLDRGTCLRRTFMLSAHSEPNFWNFMLFVSFLFGKERPFVSDYSGFDASRIEFLDPLVSSVFLDRETRVRWASSCPYILNPIFEPWAFCLFLAWKK